MKESIHDIIVAKQMSLHGRVVGRIASNLSGSKPFAAKQTSPDERIWAMDNIGMRDARELIDEYGLERFSKFYYDTQRIKQKRGIEEIKPVQNPLTQSPLEAPQGLQNPL